MPRTPEQKARRKEKKKIKAAEKKIVEQAVVSAASSAVPKKKPSPAKKAAMSVSVIPNVKGHGDYKATSKWGNWASKLGSLGGDLLSHILGRGDYYATRQPLNINTLMNNNGPPEFGNDRRNGVKGSTVIHRECVAVITGTAGFYNREYLIDPTSFNSFPWLASVTAGFSRYCFKGFIAEYRSTSGVLSGSQTVGDVILATRYDTSRIPFASVVEAENSQFSTSSAVDKDCIHGVECADKAGQVRWFNINAPVRAGFVLDPRLNQFVIVSCITNACPTTNEIGKLYFSYEIELMEPQQNFPVVGQTMVLADIANTTKANTYFWSTTGPVPDVLVFTGSNAGQNLETCFGRYTVFAQDPNFSASSITFYDARLSGHWILVQQTGVASSGSTGSLSVFNNNNPPIGCPTTVVGTPRAATGGGTSTATTVVYFGVGAGPWVLCLSGPTTWGATPSTYLMLTVLQ